MNSKEIQGPLPAERVFWGGLPIGALGILLGVLVLSLPDNMEIIPIFAPLVASPFFPFIHETHDLLAIGVGLYAAYKYGTRIGVAAILVYIVAHIPYIIMQFLESAPEIVSILVIGLITISGVKLIDRLHRNEERLHTTEMQARTTLDRMLEGCQIIGFDWRYLYVNDSAAKQGHRSKEELLGHTMMEMYPGIEDTDMFANLRNCMEARLSHHIENKFTYPDGSDAWFELSMEPVSEGVFILSLDITKRKLAEQEINLLSSIITRIISDRRNFDEAIELVLSEVCKSTDWDFGEAWLPSYDGKILECSPKWYSNSSELEEFRMSSKELTFLPNQGLPGRVWTSKQSEWISDVSCQPERVFKRARVALKVGLHAGVGMPVIAKGQVVAVLAFFMLKFHEKDTPLIRLISSVVAQLGLVFQSKQAEERIRLQAELLDAEVDSVNLCDFEGNFLYVNRAAYGILGYTREELLNMKLSQLEDKENKEQTLTKLKELTEEGSVIFNVNHRHKNGSWIPLEVHASLIEVSGKKLIMTVSRDITERKKMQEQLIAQDRLVSIGQLVAGVAHEINNPLTSVVGFSELLLQRDLPDDVKGDLKIVNAEAQRAATIVKGLLTFSRKQSEGKESIDINTPVQTVMKLNAHRFAVNNIQVNTHLAEGLPQIIGNGSQLQQVFFNISMNAEQIMLEAHGKGIITITTEQVSNIVKISFTDDGPGISPENMKKLFTPFFTTKEVGKGTGLGLSICHGIVTEHGGKIYAESELGKGATFIVELPVHRNG